MDLPKNVATVTPFSKILAMILFIALPFLGFYLGQVYGKSLGTQKQTNTCTSNTEKTASCVEQKQCSEEAKECPDGSFVFRQQPDCAFAVCSSLKTQEDVTTTPFPTTSLAGKTKEEQLAVQLSQKTGIAQLDLITTYKTDLPENSTYAGGTYMSKKRGTSGRFIASKINGSWTVTSISSGIPLCTDITPYYYPKELVPACKDAKNNIVAR